MLMDNKKNQDKKIVEGINDTFAVLDYTSIFHNKDFEVYVFKRLEKISQAVHMLGSLLTDNEPAKLRLKELSFILISRGMNLSDSGHTSFDTIKKILSTLAEIYSIFEIIQLSQLMSEMNCRIMKEEIGRLLNTINSNNDFLRRNKTYLTKDFFGLDDYKIGETISTTPSQIQKEYYKGQKDIKDSESYSGNVPNRKEVVHVPQEDKNKRQEMILSMLKDNKVLTVKDFSKEIKGCSEKTIQRELLSLVSSGTLKKEGERRWSRYSITR